VGLSLIAFDTNAIKQYVFGTDKLREIRGASSILDNLNRDSMINLAEDEMYQASKVYTNGGGAIFLVDSDKAHDFGRHVQRMYRDETGDGASITYVVQELPDKIKTPEDAFFKPELEELKILRWRLHEEKLIPEDTITLPTHPFMRPCDSCGVFYAAPENGPVKPIHDPGEQEELYCLSCQKKRLRDEEVKKLITEEVKKRSSTTIEANRQSREPDYLWSHIIQGLPEKEYKIPPLTTRPSDFNVFREFKGSKEYFALIYADANSMGKLFEGCEGLPIYKQLADAVDKAIYEAVCTAIKEHLQISDHVKSSAPPVFPFDILLMGGDDVLMVVPASIALDVALTITTVFEQEAKKTFPDKKFSLSTGVVIAPIKYPFRLLENLATTTLKFAKDEGAKNKDKGKGDARINFLIVAGSAGETFNKVFDTLHTPREKDRRKMEEVFYATLRPYDPATLSRLLLAIRNVRAKNLGRGKLHQMREAILKMNLTTSVGESRSVLRNWKPDQREYIIEHIYNFAQRYQAEMYDPDHPETFTYRVPFPWFADKDKDSQKVYRTSLLDFIELYDFVAGGEAE
jgi:hypothetical protein